METQIHHDNGLGNSVALLFGAMFNVMANVQAPGTASYFGHALIGGIIFLLFKMIGDLLTPLLRSLGERFKRCLYKDASPKNNPDL